jgi:hypothetical protein
MKVNLKDVTLVCVDDLVGEDDRYFIIEKLVKYATDNIDFGDVKLFTPKQGFHEKFPSVSDYSIWLIKELPFLIQTKYYLIFQWDGFIFNPESWNNDWFKYEYMGGGHSLQNGGFSLRNTEKMRQLASDEILSLLRIPNSHHLRFASEDLYYSSFFDYTAKNLPYGDQYGFKDNWYNIVSSKNLLYKEQPFNSNTNFMDENSETNKFSSFNYFNPNSFGFHCSTQVGLKNAMSIYKSLNVFTEDEIQKIREMIIKTKDMNNIVICGDSYSIGIGCQDLINEPYGSLLGKEYDENVINLAKGSSTNLSIFLQVKYVVENIKDIDFVCIGVTSFNRTEWFPENTDKRDWNLYNTDVNYHQYPPYGQDTNHQILEHPMVNDKRYNGEMFTENFYGIVDYVDNIMTGKRSAGNYFAKFKNERPERMQLLRDYYAEIFDDRIQRQYDIGVIVMAHLLLKKRNIKHLILTYDNDFTFYVPDENLCNVDWGKLSLEYPDDLGTLHTSYIGQEIVYKSIKEKLEKNGWK